MRSVDGPAHAVVVGAGFCGLTAAYELANRGFKVTVIEQEAEIGGLAGSFLVNGVSLEKFYHHWFTSDQHIFNLVSELGANERITVKPSRTGMFYANSTFRLTSPWDVLRFRPLRLINRVRLGLLALRVRRIREWRRLESVTAAQWLREMAGRQVYEVVWEPLLRGKFGIFAEQISAVWFWNKLKLRGGSRAKAGEEQLAYFQGGFAYLADLIEKSITSRGGHIRRGETVTRIVGSEGRCHGVMLGSEFIPCELVIATAALPIVANLVERDLPPAYIASLRRIQYLGNLCLVLELDRSLSDTYWLNVNDPNFPFVAVVEHTNFESPDTYRGRHIVYLSKYLPDTDPYFHMSRDEVLQFTLPHIQRMFPAFSPDWIREFHVWRARYSQPLVECHYSRLIPASKTPMRGLYLASMAQIYPEDRGTNYAVREGRKIAALASSEYMAELAEAAPAPDCSTASEEMVGS